MQYPQGPHFAPPQHYANPYAAPGAPLYRQNVFVPPGAASGALVSPTLRKLKLGFGIVQVVALLAAIGCCIASAMTDGRANDVLVFSAIGGFATWYLFLFAYGITNMVWIHQFWSWIPPDQRHTNLWKKYVSPGMASVFMLIPYFNIYWMFVVYLGIADILERMRVMYPTSKPPAKNLALVTLLVPMFFFPAAPFFQFFFAKHVEAMAREMQSRMAGAQPVT